MQGAQLPSLSAQGVLRVLATLEPVDRMKRLVGLDPVWWTSSERRIRCPHSWPRPSPTRRPRRRFDDDFKAQAVRLVLDEGRASAPSHLLQGTEGESQPCLCRTERGCDAGARRLSVALRRAGPKMRSRRCAARFLQIRRVRDRMLISGTRTVSRSC
jgi:hypothetical protein